jgi:hypothetical protein
VLKEGGVGERGGWHWQLVASVAQQQEATLKTPFVPIKGGGPARGGRMGAMRFDSLEYL